MFCRIFGSAVSHELVVKIIFVIVLFVLVLNLYILSIIFKSEEVTYKRIPDKVSKTLSLLGYLDLKLLLSLDARFLL